MGLGGQDRINVWKANVAGEAALQETKALEAHWRNKAAATEHFTRRGLLIRIIATVLVVSALVILWLVTA